MTFIELVEAVSLRTGKPKKLVKEVLYAATDKIKTKVVDFEGDVKIPGFGRFSRRTTKVGKTFGRDNVPRVVLKFTPYEQRLLVEKLGVVLEDDSMTKTGAIGSLCPKCGTTLETPKKCHICGTLPFEKRPPQQPKKQLYQQQ